MINCPVDGAALEVVDHAGIDVDRCPRCRGVWLEPDELDQLVDGLGSTRRSGERNHQPVHRRRLRGGRSRLGGYHLDDDDDEWDDRARHRNRKRGDLSGESSASRPHPPTLHVPQGVSQ